MRIVPGNIGLVVFMCSSSQGICWTAISISKTK